MVSQPIRWWHCSDSRFLAHNTQMDVQRWPIQSRSDTARSMFFSIPRTTFPVCGMTIELATPVLDLYLLRTKPHFLGPRVPLPIAIIAEMEAVRS